MKLPFHLISEADFDVVGFGTNAVDHLIQLPEFPEFDSKVELLSYCQSAGGEVASTMVGLQRLGFRTSYIGRFGDDPAGALGLESLVAEGVDIGRSEVVEGAETQLAFVLIDTRNGERTVLWRRDANLAYIEAETPLEAAIRGRVLHLTPHDTLACVLLAKAARAKGILVSIDVDNIFPGLNELLPLVDICIMSGAFPERFLNIVDPKDALKIIASKYGCRVVGMTLGVSGSIFLSEDTFVETPGFTVPGGAADTTGAGDAFRAGFLCGVLDGKSLEESARAANAVAALKCRRPGARDGLPSREELELLLRKVWT